MFGVGLVLVKPLLCYILSLSGQRNNLFLLSSRGVPVRWGWCVYRGVGLCGAALARN